jgi:hypothetical protein
LLVKSVFFVFAVDPCLLTNAEPADLQTNFEPADSQTNFETAVRMPRLRPGPGVVVSLVTLVTLVTLVRQ